ncbi:malto-oligosyltrehalose synthase [Gordonia hirsuta DSM 44140 = NBRC 16056]|uniref:Malto-oligosyltrehalose synthase n=1 Tax=Gordonia hirsuta DSM 44140 = NBRC 16056 TaxID=1121927 RepID=L7L437_9ACTN|nr:malto-oligosyltrehalose synthase [Gordonia hirsuta DSM 44140 = NBRC 16056]
MVGILDDLVELGISHLYLSPVLTAMPGSQHGYDWVPPARLSAVLGGLDGFRLLRGLARAVGIGVLIDIVPNHVGIRDARHNPWWADVLRFGADSEYAGYFDLHPVQVDGIDQVILLPYLGRDDDLAELTLDDDGYLHLHEWVMATAPGSASPGDDPTVVLERQHYRFTSSSDAFLGYRRFLDINELAVLRTEIAQVFDATHGWLRELVAEDLIDGVRVDHLDGLADPPTYLARLRSLIGPERLIYVEKGLAVDEELDPRLPINGTTGYEQLQLIEAAFTAPPGIIELDEIYRWVTGFHGDDQRLAVAARQLREETMRSSFSTRLRWASQAVSAVAPSVPPYLVEQAVAAFIVPLTVNRPDYPQARETVLEVIEHARAALPGADAGFDALRTVFSHPDDHPEAAFRVSDLASVVSTKAIENVGFHRTARLISAQELGCNPRRPTVSRSMFHERNRQRAAVWPLSLTAISTHDTKRSGDVRARIAVIAQVPQRWHILVRSLWRLTPPPHERTAYLLLQNIVGTWPADGIPDAALAQRLAAYTTKAMREAAVITSWAEPNIAAEQETLDWVAGLLTGEPATQISAFVDLIAGPGRDEALARTAIALLGPGVADIYQGSQWWFDALTDPDNRRPVDYGQCHDHPKFVLISQALALRRRHPEAFGRTGTYLALIGRGERRRHLLAFARGEKGQPPVVVVVAARMTQTFRTGADRAEAAVDLPAGRWRDVQTDAVHSGFVRADHLLGDRSVAILERAADE